MKLFKKTIKYSLVFLMMFSPLSVSGRMQSPSYVIHENINHSFSGPVISNVSHSVSGVDVTVTWDTSFVADGFVIFDTDSGFSASKEQGSSVKSGTSQSVLLAGLEEDTTYYYQVRSERINGGVTTDTTSRSFTTLSSGVVPATDPEPASGGGGVLIIDKTDKISPVISEVQVAVDDNIVEISWITDEEATSFVEFGGSEDYGYTYGNWQMTNEHKVVLENLKPKIGYHFRVVSSDDWGNIGYSDDSVFTLDDGVIEDQEIIDELDNQEGEEEEGSIIDAARTALDFVKRLFPHASLNEKTQIDEISTIEDLSNFVPAPILSGEPVVKIGATDVEISWDTDIESTSQVAIAPENEYWPNQEEPYQQIVGDTENKTTSHTVRIYGLSPNTDYHYQLRSKADFGPLAVSRDFTFTTGVEEFRITSFFSQVIDDKTAVFKWVTNKDANSEIRFIPYHGNELAIDESKTIKDNQETIIHEIEVGEFQAGVFYDIEISSMSDDGSRASQNIVKFSTVSEDLPPVITQIKTDSTIFIDKNNKIQTVMSWMTNEPSTSRVYYQEGVHGGSSELTESTGLNEDYIKEHVVVATKFKPGTVYTFRVESIDSGGNVSLSKPHTFMTAKKTESIIQMILRILEDTFGWVKDLM